MTAGAQWKGRGKTRDAKTRTRLCSNRHVWPEVLVLTRLSTLIAYSNCPTLALGDCEFDIRQINL